MPNRNIVGDYRYNYQGQELDPETAKVAFELRLYDPRINRWLTTDPAGQYHSPYMSMGNNWVNHVDPDGGEDNPIYGSDGTFRGVDEFGLDGEAIVYDGAFTNGMSQSEILSNGGFHIGDNFDFMNGAAGNKIMNHFMGIPDRPDFDGVVTFGEARDWSRSGDGSPLYININKMNFGDTSLFTGDFDDNNFAQVNFWVANHHILDKGFLWRPAESSNPLSWVFGTLRMNLTDATIGEVSLQTVFGVHPDSFDTFDFNKFGAIAKGIGIQKEFDFIGYGKGRVNLTKPRFAHKGGRRYKF